jgi:hypothetical protein
MNKLYILLPLVSALATGCGSHHKPPHDSSIAVTVTNLNVFGGGDVSFATSLNQDVHTLGFGKSVTINYAGMVNGYAKYPNIRVQGRDDCVIAEVWPTTIYRLVPLIASPQCKFINNSDGTIDCHGIYTITCNILGSVAIKASGTSDPVTVRLSTKTAATLEAAAPVQLDSYNKYNASAKLKSQSTYNVNVSPLLDSRDYVASFPKTVNSNAKTVAVEYKRTDKRLVAPVSANEFNRNQLISEHYNAAIITGLHYSAGKIVSGANAVELTRLSSTDSFKTFLAFSAADVSAPGFLDALPSNVNLIIDLSTVKDTKFVDFANQFAKKFPHAQLSFSVPANLDSKHAQALQSVLQNLGSSKQGWNGFVNLPAVSLTKQSAPAFLTGLSSQNIIISVADSVDASTAYSNLKAQVTGLVVTPDANTKPMSIAKAVFLS